MYFIYENKRVKCVNMRYFPHSLEEKVNFTFIRRILTTTIYPTEPSVHTLNPNPSTLTPNP